MNFKFEFPFHAELSENKRLIYSPRAGRFVLNSTYRDTKSVLTALVKQKAKRLKFNPKKRVVVNLEVYRPNNRFDASNFIKVFNDAISAAIGVNDNMFDGNYWGFIDKKNPRFEVFVYQ